MSFTAGCAPPRRARKPPRALDATRERYRVGAATLLEVTQARATYVEAASGLVNARYALVLQRTLLDYYVGDLDPAEAALR